MGTQKNHLNETFDHPKYMLKLMGKKIFIVLLSKNLNLWFMSIYFGFTNEAVHEMFVLIAFFSKEGSEEPAPIHRLATAFAAHIDRLFAKVSVYRIKKDFF